MVAGIGFQVRVQGAAVHRSPGDRGEHLPHLRVGAQLGVGGAGRIQRGDLVRVDVGLAEVADRIDERQPLATHGQPQVERHRLPGQRHRQRPPLDLGLEGHI